MIVRSPFAALRPGTFVVVHADELDFHHTWTARVVEHQRAEGKLTGLTDVEVIDACGYPDLRPGLGVTVPTRELGSGPLTMADAASALVISAIDHHVGALIADEVMETVGTRLGELIASVARYAAEAATVEALEYTLWALQNYRHHSEIDPQHAKAWWLTWNVIASHIDIFRCPDCSTGGMYNPEPGERSRRCPHPGIERWAGADTDSERRTSHGYLGQAQALGYIPERWVTR
ncbi:hypothetical protein [Nocardia altamirensis]|uniref:hypothetical protein n=1 Tax=Nocardia altamirensis TaxID=472158 RepID=UPI0008406EB6|nr:hypothetical protein [Nocardia altamirensis]